MDLGRTVECGLEIQDFSDRRGKLSLHAWTIHDGGVIELLYNPFLRVYKGDPCFIAFAQKIGVMPKGEIGK